MKILWIDICAIQINKIIIIIIIIIIITWLWMMNKDSHYTLIIL